MIVTRLKLTNVRGIEDAEFAFKAGLNLIVGVNGVGKTTALDVLRVCFSRAFQGMTPSKSRATSFELSDIRLGFPFLSAVAHFEVEKQEFRFERLGWRDKVATDNEKNLAELRREIIEADRLSERPRKLLRELATPQSLVDTDFYSPDKSALRSALSKEGPPLAVFYSTNRSVITAAQTKGKSVGGQAAAYAEALLPRSWNVEQFADWIRVQQALAKEREDSGRHIAVMKAAAARFLPGCTDLSAGSEKGQSLIVTKGDLELDVRQLSDGERGVLGIALDLARRLSQANPVSVDPLCDGQAVVLIDEIDLHLHPTWQRQIVRHLESTFPKCQFIATTHSPQVVGEVPRDRVQILTSDGVESPAVAMGADSNWLLDHVLGGASESSRSSTLTMKVESEMAQGDLVSARASLEQLRLLISGETGELARLEGGLSSLELLQGELENETDSHADD